MGKQRRYTQSSSSTNCAKVEVLIGQGKMISEAARKLGMTERTYYRWGSEYGGMKALQVRKLKELERENTRLKKVVAERHPLL